MAKSYKFKQLSFGTTLRNPERIGNFLTVLFKYNKKILTSEIIKEIEYELVIEKFYRPDSGLNLKENINLKKKFSSDDEKLTREESKKIIDDSSQTHSEKGWEKGIESRFWTQYSIINELGLAYTQKNEEIIFSELGEKFVEKILDESIDSSVKMEFEQSVFKNSLMFYQQNNPFRDISKTNKPFSLLVGLTRELKKMGQNDLISKNEIAYLTTWIDSDVNALALKIISSRERKLTVDLIYEEILEYLEEVHEEENLENRFKFKQIMVESIDDFIRKFRLAGIIEIRGMNKFISLNRSKFDEFILVENDNEFVQFKTKKEYFNEISKIRVNLEEGFESGSSSESLKKWVGQFEMETLIKEMKILANKKDTSKHDLLKYIPRPLRLEFLTALLFQKKYPELDITPNYKVDDEGVPISYAPGGKADINIILNDKTYNLEVSLQTGRIQTTNELLPIYRHMLENNSIKSIYVSPSGHHDIDEFIDFKKEKHNQIVEYYTINDLIENLENDINIFNGN